MLCSLGLQVLRVPHRVGSPEDVPLGGCWSPCPSPADDAVPSGTTGTVGTPGLVTQRRSTRRLVSVLVPLPVTLSSAGLWALQVPGVGAMQSHAVSEALLPESPRVLWDQISELLAAQMAELQQLQRVLAKVQPERAMAATLAEVEAAEATWLWDEISALREELRRRIKQEPNPDSASARNTCAGHKGQWGPWWGMKVQRSSPMSRSRSGSVQASSSQRRAAADVREAKTLQRKSFPAATQASSTEEEVGAAVAEDKTPERKSCPVLTQASSPWKEAGAAGTQTSSPGICQPRKVPWADLQGAGTPPIAPSSSMDPTAVNQLQGVTSNNRDRVQEPAEDLQKTVSDEGRSALAGDGCPSPSSCSPSPHLLLLNIWVGVR
ncbi:uncharacterized protein LOC136006857 [Lathamus discolor]|uniref:uncharacterized protein LOC136006857 n=1 Tax=Lathamus discolor TaxID=678569 RepID=UPI0032B73D05